MVAPADGLVTMVFDTKHAISMQTDNGAELIIHIGLDTVQLKGQYFDAHVAAGDKVKQGDLLLDFDIDKIKEAGYDVTTPVIICNTPQFPKMECVNGMEVKAGETAIIMSIMAMNTTAGDEVIFRIDGPDEEAAMKEVEAVLETVTVI